MGLKALLHNIRFYILCFSILLSLGIYLWVIASFSETIQTIRLTQFYALTALFFLYSALLAGPLCYTFKFLPFRAQYLKARRAIGVSSFYFALLHAGLAFFGQLGGFGGLMYLSQKYILALSLSCTALIILFFLAATSFDAAVKKLQFKNWKLLHRFVYLAGVFIMIHAVMLGTHFQTLSKLLPQFIFSVLAFLIFLELLRIDAFLKKKFPDVANVSFLTIPLFLLFIFGVYYFLFPQQEKDQQSFGIHSQHIQLARGLQSGSGKTIPGSLDGDPSRRYSVSFNHPEKVEVNKDTKLSFTVYDANTGAKQFLFQKLLDKYMHLIIVDSSLQYFNHIHPEPDGSGFSITTKFPSNGSYRLYTDFQPHGALEQQFGFSLNIGNASAGDGQEKVIPMDTATEKRFGNYRVKLSYQGPLKAKSMSNGEQQLTFTIADATTGKPVTTLKPYLASFGHLVMIRKQTFEYLHVHPVSTLQPAADANGGPDVVFLPLGLWGEIKPGTYRIFAQFNPNNELITTDFTVVVE